MERGHDMGLFTKDPPVETENSEDTKSSIWGGKLAEAIAHARGTGVANEKGTKAKRSNTQKSDSGGGVSKELSEAARKMFEPEAWRAIVRAPFALGKVMTGRSCWELEKKQEDTLATSTSLTAEYFLNVDPKYVVLTLFLFNWSVVLTEKFAANAVERNKELAMEEKLNPKPKQPQADTGHPLTIVPH